MKELVFLSGLPRSGSSLLCNMLASHPDLHVTPSSPLCSITQNMRKNWSDDPFLLAQLDTNFDEVYARLVKSTKAFMEAWSEESNVEGSDKITIDKNRGWLFQIETLKTLYPNFKMIITLRDLKDVYSSIERRHRETLLLEFPDHMEHNLVDIRANILFADQGVIGSPVKALYNLGDVPNILPHLYIWRYEDFVMGPQKVLDNLYDFLGVDAHEVDLNNIEQKTHESDSYYRMKYPHTVKPTFQPAKKSFDSMISPRILNSIEARFKWFYDQYYNDMNKKTI